MIKKQKTMIFVILLSLVGGLFSVDIARAYTEEFRKVGDNTLEIWSDGGGTLQKDDSLCAGASRSNFSLAKLNPPENYTLLFPVLSSGVDEAYMCQDVDTNSSGEEVFIYRLVYKKGDAYQYEVYTRISAPQAGEIDNSGNYRMQSRGEAVVSAGSSNGQSGGSSDCQPGDDGCCGGVKTSIITGNAICGGEGESVIFNLLLWVLRIMTAGVGIAAVGGIGYGALLYTTAEGKPEQTKKAIGIITNVVIGIAAYAFMFILLNFLIPGGVFTG